jgi:riboflavin kinase/FMN adenylyltransferase
MEIVRLDGASGPRWPRPAVAVGNFDGVHRGHQALVAAAARTAAATSGTAVVLTFDPHPARVVAPDAAPAALMTLEQKAAVLGRLGVHALAVLPFTPAVAAASPAEFADAVLARALGASAIVVGSNFRFGHGRAGDAGTLRGRGFTVVEVAPVMHAGARVSSSRVREALAAGEVGEAAVLLGRRHVVEGPVVAGDGRGRTLGIPTANVAPRNETLPAVGVYAAWAWPEGRSPGLAAVVNVGRRPTFGGGAVSVEAHLLDFAGDLYGAALAVAFEARLRGERTFDGPDALVARIREDIASARARLLPPPPASPWDGI